MATQNFRQIALSNLNLTLADLRNPESRALIVAEAERLKSEATRTQSGDRVTQQNVATALATFPGFMNDPEQYGPTTGEIADHLRESGVDCKNNAIAQHLHKMRGSGIIDSARKLETNGRRGAPPVFWFCVDEDSFNRILSGELTVNGE
jgi:hypothetical protein